MGNINFLLSGLKEGLREGFKITPVPSTMRGQIFGGKTPKK